MEPKELEVDDFVAGLLCGLAIKRQGLLSIRDDRFYSRVQAAFDKLLEEQDQFNVESMFWISRHPIHRDSQTVREALSTAVVRDLVSLDNPEYQDVRLKLTPSEARSRLESIPGGERLFVALADEFLKDAITTA